MSVFSCKICGRKINKPNSICSTCQEYKKQHKEVYKPNDELGVQDYDFRGRPICKICGLAFDELCSHLKTRHNITVQEYRNKFKLPSRKFKLYSPRSYRATRKQVTKETNEEISKRMKEYWANVSDEERERRRMKSGQGSKRKQFSEEYKEKARQRMKEYWANLPKDKKEERVAKSTAWMKNKK